MKHKANLRITHRPYTNAVKLATQSGLANMQAQAPPNLLLPPTLRNFNPTTRSHEHCSHQASAAPLSTTPDSLINILVR